jgi:hypothetical protein
MRKVQNQIQQMICTKLLEVDVRYAPKRAECQEFKFTCARGSWKTRGARLLRGTQAIAYKHWTKVELLKVEWRGWGAAA